jgi:prepilin-type N-terminal cleavage/methylation domain-containing protein
MKRRINYKSLEDGFSLVEMAVVIVILGFIIGALLLPLQAQRENTFRVQTENQLETARKALIGFAQANGYLPCPATSRGTGVFPDDQGIANASNTSACIQQVGFLPAATLGIQPVDAQGFALDGWGNRIRYAVTQSNANAFVTPSGMRDVGVSALAPDDIRVCSTSAGITPTTCAGTNYLINNAVVVIYSTGAMAAQDVGGSDELANLNDADADGVVDDVVFVSHEPRSTADPNGEFDHMVTWISPYVLYNAMIEAGQLH